MRISRREFGKAVLGAVFVGSLPPVVRTEPQERGKKSVGVLLYDGALILDYGIAGEMLAAADFMRAFSVWTFGTNGNPVTPHLVGKVSPDHDLSTAPPSDVLIVPGGTTWPSVAEDEGLKQFLRERQESGTVLFSVCTGSLLLAKAGVLKGRRATTLHTAIGRLEQLEPTVKTAKDEYFVDDGNLLTCAGSGAAIDATLHLVRRLTSKAIAEDLALRYLDYKYWAVEEVGYCSQAEVNRPRQHPVKPDG